MFVIFIIWNPQIVISKSDAIDGYLLFRYLDKTFFLNFENNAWL